MTQPNSSLLDQINIAMIRLDAKVDNILNQLHNLYNSHQDHETRLRVLEAEKATNKQLETLETKVQMLDSRPYVAPATVWKAIGAVSAIATLVIAIINVTK